MVTREIGQSLGGRKVGMSIYKYTWQQTLALIDMFYVLAISISLSWL